ncbi:MAG TPA: hypothetical protein VGX76_17480 [Pirellulales bacterium]|nr:hypothetical protein [Pirellulales bacterium]
MVNSGSRLPFGPPRGWSAKPAGPRSAKHFEEHRRDYGEVLPHVFFGDLTRFVQVAFGCSRSSPARQIGSQIIRLLELGISSTDERLQELVSVSFLEDLDHDHAAFDDIVANLGPTLKKELAAYE